MGDTASTTMASLFVVHIICLDLGGGYSVSLSSFSSDPGSMEMPVRLCSGEKDLK